MASHLFVPGPAYIYVCPVSATLGATLAGSAHLYLGQTEGDLMVSEQVAEEDVYIDASGPRVPFDVQIMGKECFLGGTLVKFDEAVWQPFASRLATSGLFGAVQANEVGTLLRTERKYFQVVVVSPYQAKAAYSTMAPGYTFYCAWLHGNADATLSTQRKRQRFQIRCLPDWIPDPTTGAMSGVICTPTVPSGLPAPL